MKFVNKQYSNLKIFYHKELLDNIRIEKMVSPLYIRIKPTNLCNHHCFYCTYGSGKSENKTRVRDIVKTTDMIPWDKMQEVIKDIAEIGTKAVTFSGGGEPLTYPKIVDAVKLLKSNQIDLSLISNGQLLQEEIAKLFYDAKWVRISFDSPNEMEYMKLRNVSAKSFRIVCNNIKDFAEKKSKNCTLGINFVVTKDNYFRVYEAAEFLKNLGVDNVKFAAVVSNESQYHLKIKDAVISQIYKAKSDFEDSSFSIINNYEYDWMDKKLKEKNFQKCYICRFVTVIGADSNVYLCHTRAYDSNAILGSIKNQSFKSMWNSKSTREKMNLLDPVNDCRNFCVYEERNQLIQSYFDVDLNHVNFI